MRNSRSGHLPALAVLALATTACGHAVQSSSTSPAPNNNEYTALAEARADSARMKFVKADVDFMSGMIHHHSQALVMADWAPSHGASPEVRTLASRIDAGQRDEIILMQRWLRDRHQAVPDSMAMGGMNHSMPGMNHSMPGMDSMPLMPGMLTAAQMAQLDSARGTRFDRLFLTFMIQHHKGALTMVDALFGSQGAAQDEDSFRLASNVYADQSTEINRMTLMLNALPPGGNNQ
ncbi:MAG: DUF305 domain-containing protein [Gemmatimonadota bacterium]